MTPVTKALLIIVIVVILFSTISSIKLLFMAYTFIGVVIGVPIGMLIRKPPRK